MEFMTAKEASKQTYINIELYMQREIQNAVKAGKNTVRILTTKIPDYILDKFKDLGYNIEENQRYFEEYSYRIKWE